MKNLLEISKEEIELYLYYKWILSLSENENPLKYSTIIEETEIDNFEFAILIGKLGKSYPNLRFENNTILVENRF